jgi:hypothetical protein
MFRNVDSCLTIFRVYNFFSGVSAVSCQTEVPATGPLLRLNFHPCISAVTLVIIRFNLIFYNAVKSLYCRWFILVGNSRVKLRVWLGEGRVGAGGGGVAQFIIGVACSSYKNGRTKFALNPG